MNSDKWISQITNYLQEFRFDSLAVQTSDFIYLFGKLRIIMIICEMKKMHNSLFQSMKYPNLKKKKEQEQETQHS